MRLRTEPDPQVQRREGQATRVAWAAMAAFVLAGLLGLLGSSPVSATSRTGSEGLVRLDYHQVVHQRSAHSMTVVLSPAALEGDHVSADMTDPWMAAGSTMTLTPRPTAQWLVPGGVRWQWPVEDVEAGVIHIAVRPGEAGLVRGLLTVEQDAVAFTQLVLP